MNRREFVGIGLSSSLVAAGATRGFSEYLEYDAVGLADLIRRQEVTATEVLDAAIARCETVDPHVNAVVVRHFELAREFIRAGLPAGKFTGVPFLLKDMTVGLAGTVTTQGSHLFEFKAERDSEIVARFKRAGLVIFGKTATPEA
jgi:amidase